MNIQDRKIVQRSKPDYPLILITAILVAFGLLMVFSATTVESLHYGDPMFYFKKQIVYVFLGGLAMFAGYKIDYINYKKYSGLGLLITGLMLLVVFLPVMGRSAGGAARWIDLGFFSFQPSEIAKIAVIIYLADALSKKGEKIKSFLTGLLPLLMVVGFLCVLILAQPDLGTVISIFLISMSMLFISGADWRHLLSIMFFSGIGIFTLSFLSPYKWRRIIAFIDPWNDPRGTGFHIIQSLIAIGSGGIFGFGLGNSRQKFMYLPEQYTDFIFAIVCEETGLFGAFLLIIFFIAFVSRCFRICRSAPDKFSMLLAGGIASYIGIQAFINMCVATSLLPTTGIPLPFISYGGTSLIITMFSVGILLNISTYKNGQKK